MMGIYKILNIKNNKYYIGKSKNLSHRWIIHKHYLQKNTHHNKHLQNAWNKYGESSFQFIICDIVKTNEELSIKEQNYLNICKSNPSLSYNISYNSTSGMCGRKHSACTINKMKLSQLGSKNHRYGKTHSEEHKQLLREKSKQFRHTETAKLKIKLANIGSKSPRYNHKVFTFQNNNLNIIENCTMYDLTTKYNLNRGNVSNLVHGKIKSTKGWFLAIK